MTACATEPGNGAAENANEWAARPACVITADGTYAARLALDGESRSWYPERWTLDGAEPYAVPLPAHQPEEPGTEVLPLTDGRVLIHRETDGRHAFSLLYPTGPGTGELPLGAVECPDEGTRLRLLPPAPDGDRAYALAVGRGSTAVWLVAGGAFGPEHLAEVPGRCSGGVWLDGTGRLLALDRFQDGHTKTIVVDLERGGEVSPLLQIADTSNDRLLLADPDSGLLLIRSDAPSPGRDRLGWGVLGSTLPVRFPESLHLGDCAVTPFAIQPGQVLMPENSWVALRIDSPAGSWVGLWCPAERQVHHLPAPEGWLTGAGLWSRDGVLQLPYATGAPAYGVTRVTAPAREPERTPEAGTGAGAEWRKEPKAGWVKEPERSSPLPPERPAPRPIPLQQAPLTGRTPIPADPAARTPGPAARTPGPAAWTPSTAARTSGPATRTPGPAARTPGPEARTPRPEALRSDPAALKPTPAELKSAPASLESSPTSLKSSPATPTPLAPATTAPAPTPALPPAATPPPSTPVPHPAFEAVSGAPRTVSPRTGMGKGSTGQNPNPAETPALAPG